MKISDGPRTAVRFKAQPVFSSLPRFRSLPYRAFEPLVLLRALLFSETKESGRRPYDRC
jgi:hypothetical protein